MAVASRLVLVLVLATSDLPLTEFATSAQAPSPRSPFDAMHFRDIGPGQRARSHRLDARAVESAGRR